jgi:hypothetical protein
MARKLISYEIVHNYKGVDYEIEVMQFAGQQKMLLKFDQEET